MAAVPSATESINDPGLGVAGAVSTLPVVIGTTSLGDENAFVRYSSLVKLVEERGDGPGVEAAALILAASGGPVGLVSTTNTIAASNGSVTASGGGPTVTVAGAATLDFDARIEVMGAGILGTGTFRYSLDTYTGDTASERTYSPVLTIPSGGTYLLPGFGITVTFAAGTYVLAEIYTWSSACAAANATNIGTAMDALDASQLGWRFALAVTSANSGDTTAHAALAAAFESKLGTMATASKYRRGMINVNVDNADPLATFGTVSAIRSLQNYGTARVVSPISRIGYAFPSVPGAILDAAQAARSLISTDLKRVNSGSLPNVVKLFKDERIEATGLDDVEISTLTTYDGFSGFYITQGRLKAPGGSDFTIWPRGIVMDVAAETAHEQHIRFIGMGVRVNNGGTIDERDALRLEEIVQSVLDARLLSPRNAEGTDGHVSDVKYSIDRTNNVLTTSTIIAEVAIKPLGYIDYITTTLSFVVSIEAA